MLAADLRALLTTHRPDHASAGYPPWLRERATAHAHAARARGATWQTIADELGISPITVRGWAAKAGHASFVPVVVAEAPQPTPVSRFRLVSPRGFQVEGLDLEQIADLLGQIG